MCSSGNAPAGSRPSALLTMLPRPAAWCYSPSRPTFSAAPITTPFDRPLLSCACAQPRRTYQRPISSGLDQPRTRMRPRQRAFWCLGCSHR
ncbi:hypothetical protein C8Q70DRAFT_588224 [Cubamyces menziesii]|nr:hypothetical protein C8Q70DRAFT_588224 [Cubamyces menziesii]